MFTRVYVGPLVTAVTWGFDRKSPIQASKICVVGASLVVQPLLSIESTRMIADFTPVGTTKTWNGDEAAYFGPELDWVKQLACVIRHVMT